MGDDITTETVKFDKGYVYVPKVNGLGVELDEDKVKKLHQGCNHYFLVFH
jgi:L-alanine-DL-glutamate epimerase-like enolase superfamily enzyme